MSRFGRPLRWAVLVIAPLSAAGCDVGALLGVPQIGLFLQSVVGAIMWTVANMVYFDMKRRGIRGFARFVAFWLGNPATWITFFMVPEGSTPVIEPPPDDEESLFAEVRKDRRLRAASPDTLDSIEESNEH